MHPSTFINLFPPFPWKDEVFVAICFWPEFKKRIDEVICPAIIDLGLKPRIVNKSKISDSIIIEICDGLTQSKLVFSDITTTSAKHRNENVFYEVGIAHATRRPEQVILFRSDNDKLPFDVTTIRVNSYDPDNDPVAARAAVNSALRDALQELDSSRSLAVKWTADCLDQEALNLLWTARQQGFLEAPRVSIGNAVTTLVSISRLLELRLMRIQVRKFTKADVKANPDVQMKHRYVVTPLSEAVLIEHSRRAGLLDLLGDDEIAAMFGEQPIGPAGGATA